MRTHPESGRKASYVNPAHTVRFEGFTEAESAPLLEFCSVIRCCRNSPAAFAGGPGALAFWDNRSSMHIPINDYHGHTRRMLRITIAGDRAALKPIPPP